jgi:hypothetical protein
LDKSGPAAEPPPLVNSVLIWAAAAAFAVLTRDPPKNTAPDAPFGHSQNRREPLSIQLERAREFGCGRNAVSPLAIPWRG